MKLSKEEINNVWFGQSNRNRDVYDQAIAYIDVVEELRECLPEIIRLSLICIKAGNVKDANRLLKLISKIEGSLKNA